jgi:hypothetical protein
MACILEKILEGSGSDDSADTVHIVHPVFLIRIRMFLGIPELHTDPLVTRTDPDPSLFS